MIPGMIIADSDLEKQTVLTESPIDPYRYIYIYIIRNHTSVKSPLLWAILIHYYYFTLIFTWKLLLLVPGRLQKSPALALKLALVEECPELIIPFI